MTKVITVLSLGMDTAIQSPRRPPATALAEAGIRGTWQWTWISLFALLVLGYTPAVWPLALDPDAWVLRDCALILTSGVSIVAGIVFVGRLRFGLGQQRNTVSARLAVLALAMLPWTISSALPPLSVDWALIPWAIASLIVVDLAAASRWWWLGSIAVAIVVIRSLFAATTGATREQMWQLGDTPLSALFFVLVILLPLSTFFQVWLWQVVVSLDAAKSERAELARAQERLRFASDLHNIQGHHLQVIALKTELAGRLIKHNPSTAEALIAETEALAREALEDTRQLVKGYRVITFTVEAKNAASVLASAGIHVTTNLEIVPPSALDHLLGSLLREATTNIIRHSTATHVEITLLHGADDHVELRVSNDGLTRGDGAPSDGTGIIALTDDYVTAGGNVTVQRTERLFTLRGVLPTREIAS
jgi:two-component system sensor histidine kinase DesK